MSFIKNIKTGFRDVVDILMFLAIVVVAILDLFYDVNLQGGYGLFAVYIFGMIYRIGFFKNALNKYVTRIDLRDRLGLPNSKK